jgi:hypothetical protein
VLFRAADASRRVKSSNGKILLSFINIRSLKETRRLASAARKLDCCDSNRQHCVGIEPPKRVGGFLPVVGSNKSAIKSARGLMLVPHSLSAC